MWTYKGGELLLWASGEGPTSHFVFGLPHRIATGNTIPALKFIGPSIFEDHDASVLRISTAPAPVSLSFPICERLRWVVQALTNRWPAIRRTSRFISRTLSVAIT